MNSCKWWNDFILWGVSNMDELVEIWAIGASGKGEGISLQTKKQKSKCLEDWKFGPLGSACCFQETIMWKRLHRLVQQRVCFSHVWCSSGSFLRAGCLSGTRLSEGHMLCVSQVVRLNAGRPWQTGWWSTENRLITTGSPVLCSTSAEQTLPWVSIW